MSMKEILKQALIATVVGFFLLVFLFVIGALLFFLVGLVANTGSVILTALSVVAALFVFAFLFSVSLLLAWWHF